VAPFPPPLQLQVRSLKPILREEAIPLTRHQRPQAYHQAVLLHWLPQARFALQHALLRQLQPALQHALLQRPQPDLLALLVHRQIENQPVAHPALADPQLEALLASEPGMTSAHHAHHLVLVSEKEAVTRPAIHLGALGTRSGQALPNLASSAFAQDTKVGTLVLIACWCARGTQLVVLTRKTAHGALTPKRLNVAPLPD